MYVRYCVIEFVVYKETYVISPGTCIYFISFRYHRQEMKYNSRSQLENVIIMYVLRRFVMK